MTEEKIMLISEIMKLNEGYNRPIPKDKPIETWSLEQLIKMRDNLKRLNYFLETFKPV